MRRYRNYKTPTTAIEMYNLADELISLMTCPLGGPDTQSRVYRIEQALDQIPDKYYRIINKLIERRMDAYYAPNEDGFSAYDMDQAILTASGC